MKETGFPQHIQEHFYSILNEERNYIGEKRIESGFLIKRNKNKATITYDDGDSIYAAKMQYSNSDWQVIGVPSIWKDIKDLLEL